MSDVSSRRLFRRSSLLFLDGLTPLLVYSSQRILEPDGRDDGNGDTAYRHEDERRPVTFPKDRRMPGRGRAVVLELRFDGPQDR